MVLKARAVVLWLSVACAAPIAAGADGDLDPAFGVAGRTVVDWVDGYAEPTALAIDAQSRIVVAGTAHPYVGNASFLLARLFPDGALDPQFAPALGGFFRYDFALNGIGPSNGNVVTALAVQPDGKIVAAGYAGIDIVHSHFALLRVDGVGQLDASFGVGGAAHFGAPYALMNRAQSLVLDAAGQLVVGGYTTHNQSMGDSNGFQYYAATTRLTPDGRLDSTFLNGSISELGFWESDPPTQHAQHNLGLALGVGQDGRIVVTGETDTPNSMDAGALRLLDNGLGDLSFGDQGRTQLGLNGAIASALHVLPSGAAMVAGAARDANNQPTLFLVRLRQDGTPDPGFGNGGVASFQHNNVGRVDLIAPARNGGWLVEARDYQGFGIVLLRTDPRGNPDASFGTDGLIYIAFDGNSLFYAAKPALQSDGRLVVAGFDPESAASGDHDFAVMRVLFDTETIFVDAFEVAP